MRELNVVEGIILATLAGVLVWMILLSVIGALF